MTGSISLKSIRKTPAVVSHRFDSGHNCHEFASARCVSLSVGNPRRQLVILGIPSCSPYLLAAERNIAEHQDREATTYASGLGRGNIALQGSRLPSHRFRVTQRGTLLWDDPSLTRSACS